MMKLGIVFFLFFIILSSCSNKIYIPNAGFQEMNLPFIKDSVATREEIMLHLGLPQGDYENGRIIIYRLAFNKEKKLLIVEREFEYYYKTFPQNTWLLARYSLVLVFNEKNILVKHSLIEINP
jgi:hypothetical protein